MRITRFLAGAAIAGAVCAPGVAAAANAFTTGDVNMRAGPSTQFPRVAILPEGVTVAVYGCLDGWGWCDTSWRGARGWVSGRYLEQLYRGRRVLVPEYGARVGLPIISFHFGNYWDRWYSDRPWYSERPRWRRSWERGDWSWRDREWDGDRDEGDRWRRADRNRDGDWDGDRGDWDGDGDGGDRRRRADRNPDSDWDGDGNGGDRWHRADRGDGERARRDIGGESAFEPGVRGRERGRKSGACPPGLAKQRRCP